MALEEQLSAQEETRFHKYVGNAIPWGVRLLWLGFWIFAVYYTLRYLLPVMQVELVTPP